MVCLPGSPHLVQTAASEVVGDDDVGDGVEDELDVLRVGGAGHVAVDLLRRALVLRLELRLDVGRRLAVLLCACAIITRQFRIKEYWTCSLINTPKPSLPMITDHVIYERSLSSGATIPCDRIHLFSRLCCNDIIFLYQHVFLLLEPRAGPHKMRKGMFAFSLCHILRVHVLHNIYFMEFKFDD